MTNEAMPAGLEQPVIAPRREEDRVDPREAQFLTTEHWSLLATRSMSWNESFSRTSMFLSTLSAATVALALVGSVTSFGGAFTAFALIVLSVVLFLGVATFVRLTQINTEDIYWVAGMNKLRGAYVRLVPGIETQFYTGWTVDLPGISRTAGVLDPTRRPSPLHLLVTTPAVVSIISSAIAGVIVGLVLFQLSSSLAASIGAGAVALAIGTLLSGVYAGRQGLRYIARISATEDDAGTAA